MRNRRYWRFADLSDYEVVLFESLGNVMAGDGKQQVHDLIEQGAGGRPRHCDELVPQQRVTHRLTVYLLGLARPMFEAAES